MKIDNPPSSHIAWFRDAGDLQTTDGRQVKILEFLHTQDEVMLSSWARYFRNHYCEDNEIDALRGPTGLSKQEYLQQIKFPDHTGGLGPATRSADFTEILVADYLEYILNYSIPRTRYSNKDNKNSSPQGIDILGFKIARRDGEYSNQDELITCEVKAALTKKNIDLLEEAFEDSKRDFYTKTPEALNATKQRLIMRNKPEEAELIARFQNHIDNPYKKITASAAVSSVHTWEDGIVVGKSLGSHPNSNLLMLVVRGNNLMDLVHQLYEKAHAEA